MNATAPHHRRHQLATHARGRLDAAGERRLVAETLHQRDGELSGGDHVGHAGAGDGAHQRRGEYRDLGRPADPVTEQAHGEIGEQADHAGLLEEGAEQDEQIDVGGRYVGRRAVETFGTERQLVDDLVEAVAAVGQVARQVFAEQAIGKKQRADDRQGDAHHPSRRLEDQDDQHHADDHVGLGQLSGALDQVALENPLVDRRAQAGHAQQPGQRLPGATYAEGGIADVHHQQQQSDVHCPQDLGGNQGKGRGDDLEHGKGQGHGEQRARPVFRLKMQPVLMIAHASTPYSRKRGEPGPPHGPGLRRNGPHSGSTPFSL